MTWTSNLYFFIKENWICAMTRHHANNILLPRNVPFESDVRQGILINANQQSTVKPSFDDTIALFVG